MKSHARVVVIGGGVVGVNTLYHLVKKGWSDVVLLERTELTAGSTWHAAGLLPLFNMSYTVGQLHKYSVDLGRDSLRGRRNTFLAGGYPHGSIPYGYAHLYVCGPEQRVVPRTEKTKNLRGWIHFLAVVESEFKN